MDRGSPISYMVLASGVRVESSDGHDVGQVARVLQVPEKDVFDGIVVTTPAGERFADADDVAEIYEHMVVLNLDAEAAASLPRPGENPAAMKVTPDDAAESGLRHAARRVWSRLSGDY
jgi:hypothetical protein